MPLQLLQQRRERPAPHHRTLQLVHDWAETAWACRTDVRAGSCSRGHRRRPTEPTRSSSSSSSRWQRDGSDRMSCTAHHRCTLSTRIRCHVDAFMCMATTFRCCSFSSSSSFCSSVRMGAPNPKHSRSFAANTFPSAFPMALPDASWCSLRRHESARGDERGQWPTGPVAYESPSPSRCPTRWLLNHKHDDHQNWNTSRAFIYLPVAAL